MKHRLPGGVAHWHDRLAGAVLGGMTACTVLILILLVGFVAKESWPALRSGGILAFFVDQGWHPLEQRFGMLPMVLATLAATLISLWLAIPVGLACAIYACFFASKRVSALFRALLALMAGIPSVVYGLWGLTVIVPFLAQWHAPGVSLIAAGLVLALMILPTIALTSAQAMAAVPLPLVHGAAALGLGRTATLFGVSMASARRPIAAGVVLAAARAMGETMAVLMVAGNVVQFPLGLFMPVRVLTANMALEMAYATGNHRAALFVSGLFLALLVLTLSSMVMRHAHEGHHAN